MAKVLTRWLSNAAKFASLITYNDSATTYNSSSAYYSNANATLSDEGKNKTAWTATTKPTTRWARNSAALSSDTYEPSAVTFDTIYTYFDGNQDVTASLEGKVKTAWSTP